jgi:aryl-alcohol dehydrogenase-like predicted oxidoreductase/histidinol phosphatase-like enzyme
VTDTSRDPENVVAESTAPAAVRPIAIGCMRLSTAPDRDDERSIQLLHAALDAGVTLFDTADAYCLDATETGHNERLIARALTTWPGNRSPICVATKGGLTRPGGRWEADGRARALTAACEASLRALGVSRIDLYQLHAPDPRVPLATSVRSLHALRRRGLIRNVGLCNVSVRQIEEARRITEIDAVQVELSLWRDASVLGGVIDYCAANRIRVLAYRPLGGPEQRRRIESDPLLARLAADHGCTPFEVALAAVADIAPDIVPLPGPSRSETARSAARAAGVVLTDADRALLRERFPVCRPLREPSRGTRVNGRPGGSEVVLIMGLPAAGKSTLAERLVSGGYVRLNRDQQGGSLDSLLPVLDGALSSGPARVVLDNTYVTRKARGAVLRVAAQHGVPVRCTWLSTSIEDAQVNAVNRMVAKYGRLLEPEEMRAIARTDTSVFPPTVQFRYQRELEAPDQSEGFSRIDVVEFVREASLPAGYKDPAATKEEEDPAATSGPLWPRGLQTPGDAMILWCDGVLQRSKHGHRTPMTPDDVELIPGPAARLQRLAEDGVKLFGLSWLPEIAGGTMSHDNASAIFARLRALLGVEIEFDYCPHGAGPPVCWCRKPLPGLGVLLRRRYALQSARCVYVGASPQDPGFARRLGLQFRQASELFGDPPPSDSR